MTDQTLEAFRNSRNRWNMQILDNGVAVNITGGTLILTAKYYPKDADSAAVFQLKSSVSGEIEITSAVDGEFRVTLADSKTSGLENYRTSLYWDLKYIDSSGNPDIVAFGEFLILPNITNSTS